jgi:hypothetical protein
MAAQPNPRTMIKTIDRLAVLVIIFGIAAMAYDTGKQQVQAHHACQEQLKP